MKDFVDVRTRARDEEAFAATVTSDLPEGISEFYPELYADPICGNFTNTLGSDLIADLLTSSHVVVDLYDWTPAEYVRKYGVDLDFIGSLREAKLITLCANLSLERYETCHWLYELLADPRTLYRSVRTPSYFQSQGPDFEQRREELAARLLRHFASLDRSQLETYCSAVRSASPPTDPPSLASVLSHWVERIATLEPVIGDELRSDLEFHVVDRAAALMRCHLLIVDPISAALGGEIKVNRGRWAYLFGQSSVAQAMLEGNVPLKELGDYFSDTTLDLAEEAFGQPAFWTTSMGSDERRHLIELLEDAQIRAGLLALEKSMRTKLASQQIANPTLSDLQTYVAEVSASYRRMRRVLTGGVSMAATVGFTYLSGHVIAGFLFGRGVVGIERHLDDRMGRVAEHVLPRLRVVTLLSDRDSR